jgi:glycerol uptake facilitator-like aquaporin
MEKPSDFNIFLSETLGTFILSCAISFSASYSVGQQGNIFAIFAGFFLAVTVTREISGGHLNPGVTLTFILSADSHHRRKLIHQSFYYILGQLLGALLAPTLCNLLYNENMFKLEVNMKSNSLSAFLVEIVGSIIFYTAILIQCGAKLNPNEKTFSTLTIALGLLAGIAVSGNISGGGLNPAIAIGFQLSRAILYGSFLELRYSWLYILGPLIASYISAILYQSIYENKQENTFKDNKTESLLHN